MSIQYLGDCYNLWTKIRRTEHCGSSPYKLHPTPRGASQVLATESDEAAGRTDYVVTRWYRAPEAIDWGKSDMA